MRLYLDACSLNRLTDDQNQERVRLEAEAIEIVLHLVREGKATWVSSIALEIEINRNPNADRRHDVTSLLAFANELLQLQPGTSERAIFFQKLGFGTFDALHLASAEHGRAEVFLTTDDDLLRLAVRHQSQLHIRVQNPVSWYRELAR